MASQLAAQVAGRLDKTCQVTHLGYSDRERLGGSHEGVDVPGGVSAHSGGRWVTAAYEIITDSLYPRSELVSIDSKFLALSDLEHILSEDFIGDLLSETFRGQHSTSTGSFPRLTTPPLPPPVHSIHGASYTSRRLQILGTLILIGAVELITSFVEAGVFDDSLPLARDHAIFRDWRIRGQVRLVDEFCTRQYVVLAPFLNFSSDRMRHYRLQPNARMPFTEQLIPVGRGKDGDIWRTTIHPDHQFWDDEGRERHHGTHFAIKEFTADSQEDFRSEKRALKRFSGPSKGHPHLIRLLLSYQIGSRYFMIFPLAESNLREHWRKRRSDTTNPRDLTWLVQQCQGVSRGLQKIHRHDSWLLRHKDTSSSSKKSNGQNRGRHGDIKPENILCFDQPPPETYRLVIADFTLVRFHAEGSLGLSLARGIAHSPKYRPPELNLSHQARVHQSYDIWTLGCVYLEFLTWYLLGYDAVYGNSFIDDDTGRTLQTFDLVRKNDDDKFYGFPENKFFSLVSGSSSPRLKESVRQWLKYLHHHKDASPPVHQFLALIERHMLMPEHNKRAAIDLVCTELDAILTYCLEHQDTCHVGEPYPRKDDSFPPLFTESCLINNTPSTTASGTEGSSSSNADTGQNSDEAMLQQLMMFPADPDAPSNAQGASTAHNPLPSQPASHFNENYYLRPPPEVPELIRTPASFSEWSSINGSVWSENPFSDNLSTTDRGSLDIPRQNESPAGPKTPLLQRELRRQNDDGEPVVSLKFSARAMTLFRRCRQGLTCWVTRALRWMRRRRYDDE